MKAVHFARFFAFSLPALTTSLSAFSATLLPNTSFPEEQTTLDEIVVTGTRTSQTKANALGSITVIHANDIKASGQSTLTEVLQSLGHVEIISNGGMGQPQGVYIRGANANHTLVLLNGMRIQSATTGTTALEHIPLEQIDRIEILSSPASSLYGSDAIGGVIQIFTKKGINAPHLNASMGIGSYNTQQGSVGLSGATADTDFSFQVSKIHSEGFSATRKEEPFGSFNPDRDGYINTSATAQLNHRINNNNQLGLSLFHSNGTTRFDAGAGSDDLNHQQLSAFSIHSNNRINSRWNSQLKIGKSIDDAAFMGAFPSQFRTDQKQFSWLNTFNLSQGTLIAGAESTRQEVSSDTPYDLTHRTTRSAFTGYTGQYGSHAIQLNLRHDQDEQFGGRTTGLASYGYTFTPKWKAIISGGTAFKAPSFNDLYYPGFSNPNLRPEKSREWETSLRYQTKQHQASATLFDNRIHDLIAYNPNTFQPDNINEARIKGLELRYAGHYDTFSPRIALTFQSPKDENTQHQLTRRARHHLEAGITTSLRRWELNAEAVASSERFDDSNNTQSTRLGGYTLFHLSAAYPLTRDLRLRARLNNITDKNYELAYGYNTSRRSIFVSLDYQPGQATQP